LRLARLKKFVMSFLAVPLQVDARERWRAFMGAAFGILITALVSRYLVDTSLPATWLVAPMGASAVLVFAAPASPMAQPWSVLGGHLISALVGITCASTLSDPVWAGSVSVGVAIALMFSLRCLHPPGGATALLAVILHATSYRFALFPVLVNSLLLVSAGVVYNNLTGRAYPHAQRSPPPPAPAVPVARFTTADMDAALAHYNQVLDVSRDDLQELLHLAEAASYQRNLGELRCADIMSREPVAVQFGTSLSEACTLMRQRRIKALPVIDRQQRIVGIVTAADFFRQAGLDEHSGLGDRVRELIKNNGLTSSDRPEVVGQIMTRRVQVAGVQRHALELVKLFSQDGHTHIPIIDEENRLVGIVTKSDLVRALYRAVKP
jgi:CBS domain-containing membrane protein